MIVYSSTKAKFQEDVLTNDIENIIDNAYRKATGGSVGKSEKNSWKNSLQYMDRVLSDDDIPSDAGVAIEYHIPQSSKRIDFILTGKDSPKSRNSDSYRTQTVATCIFNSKRRNCHYAVSTRRR